MRDDKDEEKLKFVSNGKVNWNSDGFGIRLTFTRPNFDIYLPKRYEKKWFVKGKKYRATIEEIR